MPYCRNCGAPESPGGKFCPKCGKRRPFSLQSAFDRQTYEALGERVFKFLDVASYRIADVMRRGFDALLANKSSMDSFLTANILALFFCSFPCGLIGVSYSLRAIYFKYRARDRVNDGSIEYASRNAKLWFALAVVWLLAATQIKLALSWFAGSNGD